MTLPPGTRLGPYAIIGPVGAGGMGEVYRARDTRLGRDVAVKVISSAFSADSDRLRRFELEARAAGMLSHPNILTVHDVGSHDKSPYLVTELLEGVTLRARLGEALPLGKALEYAQEIARGLAAAHRKGIVHRDLKPENIFLTRDGRVKILDFGLAKLIATEPPGPAGTSVTTWARTEPGAILGTVGYMSPEQVRGSDADHRSDVFAFGAILYEMLTGRRAFQGDSAVEISNAILNEEPAGLDGALGDVTPMLQHLVRHCLEKDPESRFQSIGDLAISIEALAGASGTTTSGALRPAASRFRSERLAWVAVALLALLVAALTAILLGRESPDERLFTLSVPPPEGTTLVEGQAPAISPDGRILAFVASDRSGHDLLYLRSLDAGTARPLAGTQGATWPFWSPDSRTIGFFADGKLKKIEAAGGESQMLCEVSQNSRGGTWNGDGVILFTPGPTSSLHQASANGCEAIPLGPSGELSRLWSPAFLPDGRHFLYHTGPRQEVRLGSLAGRESKALLKSGFNAIYSPSGYILYRRETTLVAQRFDARRLELSGEPTPVAARVGFHGLAQRILASVSDNDVLAYHDGSVGKTQLTWFERDGRVIGVVTPPGDYGDLSLSPDGRRVAFYGVDAESGNVDIRIAEFDSSTTSRFTFDPAPDFSPIWSADGSRLFWSSLREGTPNLFTKLSSGAGNEERLLKSDLASMPMGSSPDGGLLLYGAIDPMTRWNVFVLPMEKDEQDREPSPILQTEFDERRAQISPDARWLAYVSNESGRYEVYVRAFPSGAGKWQVSSGGGDQPRWRGDGGELFYVSSDRKLAAVEVTASDSSFETGLARELLGVRISEKDGAGWHYAVTADGRRFLVNHLSEEAERASTTVLLNWTAAVPRK